jgi:phage terminase large subunit-like protein
MKSAVHNQPLMSAERIVISLDPAGEGEDEAVFYVTNNGNIVERKFIKTSTDPQLAAEAVMLVSKYKAQVFISDSIGNGVADIVSQLLGRNDKGVKVIKFKSSEKSTDPTYFNRRDQIYHQASVQMKSGNVQMDDDYTLMKQLNATKYKKDNGRIYISSKEEIKEIIGQSPDRADAWVLSVEGLKFTYSLREVQQADNFRKVIRHDEVLSGEEYGRWYDTID